MELAIDESIAGIRCPFMVMKVPHPSINFFHPSPKKICTFTFVSLPFMHSSTSSLFFTLRMHSSTRVYNSVQICVSHACIHTYSLDIRSSYRSLYLRKQLQQTQSQSSSLQSAVVRSTSSRPSSCLVISIHDDAKTTLEKGFFWSIT